MHYQGSVVIVSHDKYFLNRMVNKIIELYRNGLEQRFAVQLDKSGAEARFNQADPFTVSMYLYVLALLVALILEFDAEARREYRDAAAFRDQFKARTLTRAAVQAARTATAALCVEPASNWWNCHADASSSNPSAKAIRTGPVSASLNANRSSGMRRPRPTDPRLESSAAWRSAG